MTSARGLQSLPASLAEEGTRMHATSARPAAARMLVIHQSAELYGSDRSLLDLLAGIDRDDFACIVCLPEEGALAVALRDLGMEVHVLPLLKISRQSLRVGGLFKLPGRICRAVRALDQLLVGRKVDLVYTNTLAVFDGMLWALLRRRPHVWHVREIIVRPLLASAFLRLLAMKFSSKLICNSRNTREWLLGTGRLNRKCSVVWNGVQNQARRQHREADARRELGLLPGLPVVLMVGRINRWKGQDLLLEAVALLEARACRHFQVVLLGSAAPGQAGLLHRLRAQVAASPAASRIHLHDFAANPLAYYEAATCLVVPSRDPEPFGRVAIEAMAVGVPVIAAAHGGLTEIVRDRETGLLFAPNDAQALGHALSEILDDEPARQRWGQNACLRQQALFSLASYRQAMTAIFRSVLVRS